MSFLIIQQIVMILQAHSSYLQVHSQTILAPCQEWKDGLLFIISLFVSRELDENDVHIGKLCHAPDSPLHGPLAHNSNTWMGSNCLSIRESWGVVGICVSTWQNNGAELGLRVVLVYSVQSNNNRHITSPFGAWWATHGEPGWSPELLGRIWLTIRLVWALKHR